jgi:hypothetical protein
MQRGRFCDYFAQAVSAISFDGCEKHTCNDGVERGECSAGGCRWNDVALPLASRWVRRTKARMRHLQTR